MKRSTTEVLRRGFDSTVANWPLILVRIAEGIVFMMIILGSVVAAIVPVLVAAGISRFGLHGETPSPDAIATIVVRHAMLILYVLLIISVVLLVLVAIHSFVEAGCAKVYVDAERIAGDATPASRDRFRAFTVDRWFAGGRGSWWSVFWIYNIAWSFGGLIVLIPLMLTLIFMILVDSGGARLAVGCGGLALSFLLMIPVAVIMSIWTQKATAIAVGRSAAAPAALRLGWHEIGSDAGRHIAVALIVLAVSFGGAMLISFATIPMSIARMHQPMPDLAFAPAQIGLSFVQSIFTSAVGLWFLASYVALTEERK